MRGRSSNEPPVSGRFRKGQSGNPKGRPRKEREAVPYTSAFDVIVDRTLTVLKDGVAQELSVEEALQHKTYQQAIAGDRAARREVLKMILKREQALAKLAPPKMSQIEMRTEEDPDNANDAFVILGLARRYTVGPNDQYDRMKLEPWAVQAALRRRRGGARLTTKEIEEIRRSAWDPEKLVWPRGTEV